MTEENCSHHGVEDNIEGAYPNETIRLLINRASCRTYLDKKISPDLLDTILQAAARGPSGGNLQPFSIIKIEKTDVKKKIAGMCQQAFIGQAPVDLLFCIDWYRTKKWAELERAPYSAPNAFRHFWISFQDTVIAAQNVSIAAEAMGLGSVYIGTVLECVPQLSNMLDLPPMVFPVVLLCLGYPKNYPAPRKKLAANILVHNEKYKLPDDKSLLEAFDKKYKGAKKKLTEERLQQIEKVCTRVHGKEFAQDCLERIESKGYIGMANHYFGLHYVADKMPVDNDKFLKQMEECGFNWFKKYIWKAEDK